MNDHETNFEQNLARMLKASCGPGTRVTPDARERLRHELAATLRVRRQPSEFPGAALAALSLLVLLLWAAAWPGGAGLPGKFPAVPVMVLAVVNLAGIPIASLVIVLRRRYV